MNQPPNCTGSLRLRRDEALATDMNQSPSCTGSLQLKRDALVIEWKIDSLLLSAQIEVNSSIFVFSSTTWYLNLRICKDDKKWLSLCLCSTDCQSPQIVEFGLGIKNLEGALCFQRTFIRKYEGDAKYGIEYFARISELIEGKGKMTTSGSFIFVCNLRSLASPIETNTGFVPGFLDMLSPKKQSDLCIHVKDQKFQAHKVILAASSEVFSAMFEHEMSENNSDVLIIEDCDPESFQEFLHFLYTRRMDITDGNVCQLYAIGHTYRVQDLIVGCVVNMIRYLSVDNVTEIATLGHRYSDNDVTLACSKFFERNVREILLAPQWKLLMKDNYLVAYELLEYIASRITLEEKNIAPGYCSPNGVISCQVI